MALDKKGGFGLDLEAQFKNAPHVAEVKPADTHAHTDAHTHTDTHTDAEVENKTKRFYGLMTPTAFNKITAYAKANKTSVNAIVCDLLDEFIREKGL